MEEGLSILAGGAAEPALTYVAEAFTKQTGHAVFIAYNMGQRGRQRMEAGEVFDVIVATRNSMNRNFLPAGKVEPGAVTLGRVGLGMMVRPGAPAPDISTVDAFKRVLLDAQAILYTEETSGLVIDDILKKLEIFAAVTPIIERFRNGPELMNRVAAGSRNEVGFLPITAILAYQQRRMRLAGPLPEAVQYYLEMMVAPSVASHEKALARRFVQFCDGPGRAIAAAHGLTQ